MSSFTAGGTTVRIDETTLREVVETPQVLANWCAEHPSDPRNVSYLRMLGRLDEAETAGLAALAEPGLSPVSRAARRTRYATVLQWKGSHLAAEQQFALAVDEASTDAPTSPSSLTVLASVFQHRAKARFEHAQCCSANGESCAAYELWQDALEDARRALRLRERLGLTDASALASSRQTLDRLERYDLGRVHPDR